MRGQSLLFTPLEAPEEHRERLRAAERRRTDGQWWQMIAELPGSDDRPELDADHLGKGGPAC
jgi:hypothetical protein